MLLFLFYFDTALWRDLLNKNTFTKANNWVNFTFGKVILGIILAFEQVNWCEKWRYIRNFGDLSLFFREII